MQEVYKNSNGDYVIFNNGRTARVHAAIFGSFYYALHGINKPLVLGPLFYSLWIYVFKGGIEPLSTVVGSALFWRSLWQFLSFNEAYVGRLQKWGYQRLVVGDDSKIEAMIEEFVRKGYRRERVSSQVSELTNPQRPA